MKIKLGFVTNSSSCSYCLWGIILTESDINDDIKKRLWEEYNKNGENVWNRYKTYEEYIKNGCLGAVLEYIEEDDRLHITTTDDSETVLGLEPSEMDDNEKLIEFKKRIVDILNKFGFSFDTNKVYFYNGITEC